MTVPKPHVLRAAIAESIAGNLKSYNVAAFCVSLGLAPAGKDEDPFHSKRVYVGSRLNDCSSANSCDSGSGSPAVATNRATGSPLMARSPPPIVLRLAP